MAWYCCDSIIKGYKGDDLDDDGTDFHQQHQQWLELLGNNYSINFCGLEDHENHEILYTTKISMLMVVQKVTCSCCICEKCFVVIAPAQQMQFAGNSKQCIPRFLLHILAYKTTGIVYWWFWIN